MSTEPVSPWTGAEIARSLAVRTFGEVLVLAFTTPEKMREIGQTLVDGANGGATRMALAPDESPSDALAEAIRATKGMRLPLPNMVTE